MVVQQSGNTILTRWYSGSSYVKETAGGVTKQYTYIGGDAYTAPVVAIKTGTGTPVYYYLLRDYLGSITHVVNTSKTTVAEYSYDAWGRMRNPTNWTNYTPGTEPALFVAGRGFTGHEHMPWFNSINMNGRVYDPLIGQFLSPDNFVQAPDFTQNYNRYTYCLNNPLSYKDPSGMLRETLPNPADAGHPYNPEAAAWLANYYMNWDYNYGGIPGNSGSGGGGGSSSWVNSYLDYAHACFENGYKSSTSNFNYEVNRQTNSPGNNGTITIQTGWIDWYNGYYDKDGVRHTTSYRNSTPIYSNISVGSEKLNSFLNNLQNALPVAITWAAVGSSEGIMAGQATPAGIGLVLRGPDRFKVFGFSSAGAGAGWVGADGSIAATYFFYTGDVNNFNRFSLGGQAWELSVSCGEGWSVGVNLAIAQDITGAYIIGIGPSAGVGVSATFFTGQYSMILTKIWRKK